MVHRFAFTRRTALRDGGLALLAVVTVVLCHLALTPDSPPDTARDAPGASSAAPTASSSAPSTEASAPTGETSPTSLPEVTDQVDADFGAGAALPSGSRLYHNEQSGTPIAVTDGALTAAAPLADGAASSLEIQLPGDVQKIGARLSFPGDQPGMVVLAAWQDSLVATRLAGDPVPDSGLRLVVSRSGWSMTEWKRREITLGTGSFTPITDAGDIAVYRSGSQLWVVDPDGVRTELTADVADRFAGPFACWQLREDSAQQTPARILAIIAG